MAKYESGVKHVPYSQEAVYSRVSDLSNIAAIKDKMNDPAYEDKIRSQVPSDKWDSVKQYVDTLNCTTDSLSINVAPLGALSVEVMERQPAKCVKYTSKNSPVPFKLWVQVLPTSDTSCKLKVTIDAELNFFIKQMVGNKLAEGVDKFADMLAMMPYE